MPLPLPNVIGDIGAAGGIPSALNALHVLRNQNLENQNKMIANQYAPYTHYADAMSKIAYSNYLPYQIQAQVLSNPLLWESMKNNPEAMQGILNRFSQSFPEPQGSPNGMRVPFPQPQQSTGEGLLNALLTRLSGKQEMEKEDRQNALAQPAASSSGAAPKSASESPASSIFNGPPSVVPPPALPGATNNPFYNVKTATAASEAQGKINADLWKELNQSVSKSGVEAQNSLNDLDRFENAYKKLSRFEKGPLFGKIPAVRPDAQIADQAVESMRASLAKQVQQGHITDNDLDFFRNLKPGRFLNEDSEKSISSFLKGTALRAQERADFNNSAFNMGLTAPQANLIWTKYIKERPFFDSKKEQLNDENLNSWQDYLEPEKLGKILNGKSNQPKKVQEPSTEAPSASQAGVKALEKGLELPSFSSKEEFQSWYKGQPKIVQDAVLKHLGG